METIANAVLAGLIIALLTVWVCALVCWDGKCHCDKSRCGDCPYSGNCEYEHADE